MIDAIIMPLSEKKTSIDQPSPPTGVEIGQGGRTYNVVQFFDDTEIVEAIDGAGEYTTFGEAKAAAIDYLKNVMDMCEMEIDEIQDCDTPEHYFGESASW